MKYALPYIVTELIQIMHVEWQLMSKTALNQDQNPRETPSQSI